MELYKKTEALQHPIWSVEILLTILVTGLWFVGCLSSNILLSIAGFTLSQIIGGWTAHSRVHGHDKNLHIMARFEYTFIVGFTFSWWGPKHNMHHLFTNI